MRVTSEEQKLAVLVLMLLVVLALEIRSALFQQTATLIYRLQSLFRVGSVKPLDLFVFLKPRHLTL